jgi:hypothetical protein
LKGRRRFEPARSPNRAGIRDAFERCKTLAPCAANHPVRRFYDDEVRLCRLREGRLPQQRGERQCHGNLRKNFAPG